MPDSLPLLLAPFLTHTLSIHVSTEFQLDRNHSLHTVLLSQAAAVLDTPDTFEVPAEEAYDEEKDNLQSWLLQPDCFDQFIVHHHNKFTVAFNARDAPIIVEDREVCSLSLPE